MIVSETVHGRVARRAFTLVEMLIAIGVVVALAAITLTASMSLARGSEIRQTENTIRLLDLALSEWEAQADKKLTWGTNDPSNGVKYDMANGTPHVFTVTEMLVRIGRSQPVKEIVAQIDDQFLYRYDTSEPAPSWIALVNPGDADPNGASAASVYSSDDLDGLGQPVNGTLAVLDAWGTPIRAVHPGRVALPNDVAPFDEDGTVVVDGRSDPYGSATFYATELIYGRAENRKMVFVSAGPDGRFGDLSAADGTALHEAAHDNVRSAPAEDVH